MKSIRLEEVTLDELAESIAEKLKNQFENDLAKMNADKVHNDDVMNRKELMEFLGCSPSTLWKYLKKGLPVYQVGKIQLYRKEEVLNFMKIKK